MEGNPYFWDAIVFIGLGLVIILILLLILIKQKPPQLPLTEEEIQEEEDAILATQAMMALGGMVSSDQGPFHHHGSPG